MKYSIVTAQTQTLYHYSENQCRGVGRLCKYRVWESGGLGTNGLIFPPDLNSAPPAGAVLMPAAPLNVEP